MGGIIADDHPYAHGLDVERTHDDDILGYRAVISDFLVDPTG